MLVPSLSTLRPSCSQPVLQLEQVIWLSQTLTHAGLLAQNAFTSMMLFNPSTETVPTHSVPRSSTPTPASTTHEICFRLLLGWDVLLQNSLLSLVSHHHVSGSCLLKQVAGHSRSASPSAQLAARDLTHGSCQSGQIHQFHLPKVHVTNERPRKSLGLTLVKRP